jgi:hypothetical protein
MTEGTDAIGNVITFVLAMFALGGYVSAVLVWRRVSMAMVPACLVTCIYLMFFPLGTLVGVIILTQLLAADTRKYLA